MPFAALTWKANADEAMIPAVKMMEVERFMGSPFEVAVSPPAESVIVSVFVSGALNGLTNS